MKKLLFFIIIHLTGNLSFAANIEKNKFYPNCKTPLNASYKQMLANNSCFFIFDNGDKYRGEWDFDRMNGMGNYLSVNGESYKGKFYDNLKHGKGKFTWKSGAYYEGDYRLDKIYGFGTYVDSIGNPTSGWFYQTDEFGDTLDSYADSNLENYYGMIKAPKMLSLSDKRIMGERFGYGVYTYINGEIYKGEWKRNKRHGYGKQIFSDGSNFEGYWDIGLMTEGTLSLKNGEKLKGSFDKDGNLLISPGNLKYIFKKGIYELNKGDNYIGTLRDNLPNGKGIYTYKNGNKVEGNFKDGLPYGDVVITSIDGKVNSGFIHNGEFFASKSDWEEKKEKDRLNAIKKRNERLAREEKERKIREARMKAEELARIKYETIYTACLLDRSVGIDMQVRELKRAVEDTCDKIAENPSWYENFKYNK